jgi:putative transposase
MSNPFVGGECDFVVPVLSVGGEMLPGMARHTTFRFCLDPTVEQHDMLARHAGASRFAFSQCLAA